MSAEQSRATRAVVPTVVLIVAVAVAGYLLVTQTGGGDEQVTLDAGATTESAEPGDPAEGDGGEPEPHSAEGEPAEAPPELSEEEEQEIIAELAALARLDEDDPLAIGDPDAPVVMIEYADYQCGYCAMFAQETMPELIDRYVDDGTLRVEWRDLPIFGEESELAAMAGRAAAEQDVFWEFHDLVFAPEHADAGDAFTEDALIDLAGAAGVDDLDQFADDLESDDLTLAVETDRAEAAQLGISSTPAFLVNGQPVMGAQPLEVFESLIEEAAAEADA